MQPRPHSGARIAGPTVLAAVVFFAVVACSLQGADAVATQIFQGTPFYLYAVVADNWVRNDVRYTPNRLRAADGISKSEATRFTAIAPGGQMGAPLTTYAIVTFKALAGTHPWCVPTNTNTGLINDTILCTDDAQPIDWLTLHIKGDSTWHAPIYAGDTIRLTKGWLNCGAPPWPTNGAALYCENTGPDNWRDFHIEV